VSTQTEYDRLLAEWEKEQANIGRQLAQLERDYFAERDALHRKWAAMSEDYRRRLAELEEADNPAAQERAQ
jgi:hypothetical protein